MTTTQQHQPSIHLRPLRAGDIGWVVSRHGAIYAQEYGWDMRFEALVARIAADYIDQLDPARENAWIAEVNGQAAACVFVVQARDGNTGQAMPGVAQLRMLLVEPHARGHGLGKLLTRTCEQFAMAAGYTRMRLWTNSLLLAARGIYLAGGYQLLASEPHHSFGHALVGEVWEKPLLPRANDTTGPVA
jgi:GNAT superfamily N-acetyltransferase